MGGYSSEREPRMSDIQEVTEGHHDHVVGHEIKLTEREMTIAKIAAKLAVKEVSNEFYRQVGRSVVTRFFVWVGLFVVGFGMAKGWIVFKP
jgi:hypothetical protein